MPKPARPRTSRKKVLPVVRTPSTSPLPYAGAMTAILLLDWLALDDITTNIQPSYVWEYAMLGFSVFALPALYLLWRKKSRR